MCKLVVNGGNKLARFGFWVFCGNFWSFWGILKSFWEGSNGRFSHYSFTHFCLFSIQILSLSLLSHLGNFCCIYRAFKKLLGKPQWKLSQLSLSHSYSLCIFHKFKLSHSLCLCSPIFSKNFSNNLLTKNLLYFLSYRSQIGKK